MNDPKLGSAKNYAEMKFMDEEMLRNTINAQVETIRLLREDGERLIDLVQDFWGSNLDERSKKRCIKAMEKHEALIKMLDKGE